MTRRRVVGAVATALLLLDGDQEPSETFPVFEHPGTEFIYMLEGKMEYRHGSSSYRLEPGDALTFNGEVPHGPGELTECPIRFITVIIYPTGGAKE